jgi:uncharacterized protein
MEIGGLLFVAIFLAALTITVLVVFLKGKVYANVSVGGYVVRAEVADNWIKQMKGLMGRETLSENEGMLFAFPTEGYHGFWMMNMSIPIDIIFIGNDHKVVDVLKDARPCKLSSGPCTTYRPKMKAMYVLEVKANFTERHGILIGSKVDFSLDV